MGTGMLHPGLKADLRRLIGGEVTDSPVALAEVAVDYGGIVRKSPRILVRPGCAEEVARVVKYAYDRDLSISPRAGGYSFGGQALNEGGVIIDMSELRAIGPIHAQEGWFEAEAGAQWHEAVKATLQQGWIPPVLTSYLRTSVGGTLSAAGFGFSSFRYGTQADYCLELEIVHHSGEIVRCSREETTDLFEHALCGFGQFGIITRARQRLRRAPPHVRTYFLQYDDLNAHLADQAVLVEEKRAHFMDGMLRPCYHGQRLINGRRVPLHSYLYPLNVTVEADGAAAIDDAEVLADLSFSKWIYAEDLSIADFILLAHTEQQAFTPKVAQVFTDALLPWSALEGFIRKVETHIHPQIVNVEHTVLWPMNTETITASMLKVPKEPLIMGVGLYSRVPAAYAAQTLAVAQGYVDLAMSMGGTYYLTGSVRLDEARLERQFGEAWPGVREVKQRYDPKGLFNPGFFHWATADGACSKVSVS